MINERLRLISLYIGCECIADGKHKSKVISVHENGNVTLAHPKGGQDKWEYDRIKLLLRPMDNMNDWEASSIISANHPLFKVVPVGFTDNDTRFFSYRLIYPSRLSNMKHDFFPIQPVNPMAVMVTVSYRLDVFGMIEKGWAKKAKK